jgi:hypothetical protein
VRCPERHGDRVVERGDHGIRGGCCRAEVVVSAPSTGLVCMPCASAGAARSQSLRLLQRVLRHMGAIAMLPLLCDPPRASASNDGALFHRGPRLSRFARRVLQRCFSGCEGVYGRACNWHTSRCGSPEGLSGCCYREAKTQLREHLQVCRFLWLMNALRALRAHHGCSAAYGGCTAGARVQRCDNGHVL